MSAFALRDKNTMQKIKVLHIIKSLGRGGAEMLLPETLKMHDKDRFEFHCIYFLPWKDQMAGAITAAGGKVTCLPAKNNIQIIGKASKVRQYIKEHQIDIIHCHLPWAGFLGRWVHRSTGVPVVYTEHNKQERYHKLTYWINRLTFGSQSKVIAVSADVAESIQKHIPAKTPVQVILNGVNTQSFKRDPAQGAALKEQLGIPSGAMVIGTVAVFRFQKRLEEWLEVFATIAQAHPEAYGIIIGDGILKEHIVAKRNALGLEQRVLMPGLQTDTIPYFSMIDIYMMTSVFEGLPIALLEAMSMECAIITTDAGGIKEVIEDGKDGLMVDVDDWKSLVSKAEELFRRPDFRQSLSAHAREKVTKQFSMLRMVRELEVLYQQLV